MALFLKGWIIVKKLIALVLAAFIAATALTGTVGCGDKKPATPSAVKDKDKDKDKDKEPKDPKQADRERRLGESGSMLVGEKGILFSPNDYGAKYELLPRNDFKGYKGPAETLPRNGKGDDGMKAEWVRAIKEDRPSIAMSNFGYAGLLFG